MIVNQTPEQIQINQKVDLEESKINSWMLNCVDRWKLTSILTPGQGHHQLRAQYMGQTEKKSERLWKLSKAWTYRRPDDIQPIESCSF